MSSVRKDTGTSPKKVPQVGVVAALGVGGLVVLAIGFWLTFVVVDKIKSGLGVEAGPPSPPPPPKASTRPPPAKSTPGTPAPTLARAAADEFLTNLREGRLRQAHGDTTREFQDERPLEEFLALIEKQAPAFMGTDVRADLVQQRANQLSASYRGTVRGRLGTATFTLDVALDRDDVWKVTRINVLEFRPPGT